MKNTLTSAPPSGEPADQASPSVPILKDLLEDGVHLLFLLRSGTAPHSAAEFNRRVDVFLSKFERNATNFGKPLSAIQDCKYAFCALLDEIILNSDFEIRDEWERNPLQLRIFGEHLAGEGFFNRLENLRLEPQKHIETIEVFYTVLILGFQGKYLLEGEDKLSYLIARIGQEILSIRGGKPEFAPHWKPTFRFQEFVRHELPMWIFYALLGIVALIVFLTFTFLLSSRSKELERIQSIAESPSIVAEPPSTGIDVEIRSNPENASLTMNGRSIGKSPQRIMINSTKDLVDLTALHGAEQAVEKRIRILSEKEVQVTFLFGEGSSVMAKALGLPRIVVFDYGAGNSFDVNQAILKPVFTSMLERQAEMLKTAFTGTDVYICGHTDSTGNKGKNQSLSMDRAQAVSNQLITLGVAKKRIIAHGYGSDIPVAPNETPEGRGVNRRTEIILAQ